MEKKTLNFIYSLARSGSIGEILLFVQTLRGTDQKMRACLFWSGENKLDQRQKKNEMSK